jgi:hypothetical protein
MQRSSIAIFGLVALVSGTAVAKTTQQTRQQPPGTGMVCGTKGGEQQSYWNKQDARRGVVVITPGECRRYGGGGGVD